MGKGQTAKSGGRVKQVPEKGKLLVKSRSDLFARGPNSQNGENLFLAECPRALTAGKLTPAPESCWLAFRGERRQFIAITELTPGVC